MKRNLVFFVYNLSMVNYLTDQQYIFLRKEYNVIVIHISKLTKDRSKIVHFDKEYNIIDISYYSLLRIRKLLKKIDPVALVFYTFHSQYDYLLLSISNKLRIPSIFHDHGIVFGESKAKGRYRINLYRIIRTVIFNFNLLQSAISDWKCNMIKDYYFNKSKKHQGFTKYFFYSKNNYNYYKQFFPISSENSCIGGVPIAKTKNEITDHIIYQDEKRVLYFHQPFVKFKFTNITYDEEIQYYNKLALKVREAGYKLTIRLHPSQRPNDYKRLYHHNLISFDTSRDILKSTAKASVVIGHWSTALAIPILLEKRTIVLSFPGVHEEFIHYYDIYKNLTTRIHKIDDITNELLTNVKKDHNTEYAEYLLGYDNTYEDNTKLLINLIVNL